MKVFVGGAFQGKKKAAMEKTGLCETDFLDGETCTKEELLTGKAVNHFHSYIRRALKEEREGALDAFCAGAFSGKILTLSLCPRNLAMALFP